MGEERGLRRRILGCDSIFGIRLGNALNGEHLGVESAAVFGDELSESLIKFHRNDDIAALGGEDGNFSRKGVIDDFEFVARQSF